MDGIPVVPGDLYGYTMQPVAESKSHIGHDIKAYRREFVSLISLKTFIFFATRSSTIDCNMKNSSTRRVHSRPTALAVSRLSRVFQGTSNGPAAVCCIVRDPASWGNYNVISSFPFHLSASIPLPIPIASELFLSNQFLFNRSRTNSLCVTCESV